MQTITVEEARKIESDTSELRDNAFLCIAGVALDSVQCYSEDESNDCTLVYEYEASDVCNASYGADLAKIVNEGEPRAVYKFERASLAHAYMTQRAGELLASLR